MRKLRLTLFLLGIFAFAISCQQGFDSDLSLETNQKSISELKTRANPNDKQVFMPLDSIPEWAKKMMTSDEYELWKALATKFNIDYSFVYNEQYELKRERIKERISNISKDLDHYELNSKFSVYYLESNTNKIEKLTRAEEPSRNNSVHLTLNVEGDVYMQFTAIYDIYYTSSTGEPQFMFRDAKFTWGPSYKNVQFKGSTDYRVTSDGLLWIQCVGKLEYDRKVVDVNYLSTGYALV